MVIDYSAGFPFPEAITYGDAFGDSPAVGPGPGPVVGREVNVIRGSSSTATGQTGTVQDVDDCCNSCS